MDRIGSDTGLMLSPPSGHISADLSDTDLIIAKERTTQPLRQPSQNPTSLAPDARSCRPSNGMIAAHSYTIKGVILTKQNNMR